MAKRSKAYEAAAALITEGKLYTPASDNRRYRILLWTCVFGVDEHNEIIHYF